jgi:hypothetical protein
MTYTPDKRMGFTIYDDDVVEFLKLKALLEKKMMMRLSSAQMVRRMVAITLKEELSNNTPIDEWRSKPMAAE